MTLAQMNQALSSLKDSLKEFVPTPPDIPSMPDLGLAGLSAFAKQIQETRAIFEALGFRCRHVQSSIGPAANCQTCVAL